MHHDLHVLLQSSKENKNTHQQLPPICGFVKIPEKFGLNKPTYSKYNQCPKTSVNFNCLYPAVVAEWPKTLVQI